MRSPSGIFTARPRSEILMWPEGGQQGQWVVHLSPTPTPTLGGATDLPCAPGQGTRTLCFHLLQGEGNDDLLSQGDCRPLGESGCQRMWVSHYILGEKHKDAKGRLDLAGCWPTCLIKCSNGLLGRLRSQSLKCLGLILGLLHGKNVRFSDILQQFA